MLYWHLLWDWPRRFSPFSQALIQSNSKLEIIRTWWLAFSNTKFYFVSLWVPIASLWYFPLFWLVIIITRTKRALIWEKKKKYSDCTCTYQLLSSCCTLIDYFFRDDTFYHFLIWEKNTQIVYVPISSCFLDVHSLLIDHVFWDDTFYYFGPVR